MLQHDKRIVHRNRLLDWTESNTTIYRDVQFSGSTIKTITRPRKMHLVTSFYIINILGLCLHYSEISCHEI